MIRDSRKIAGVRSENNGRQHEDVEGKTIE